MDTVCALTSRRRGFQEVGLSEQGDVVGRATLMLLRLLYTYSLEQGDAKACCAEAVHEFFELAKAFFGPLLWASQRL